MIVLEGFQSRRVFVFWDKTSDPRRHKKRNPGILHEIPGLGDEVITLKYPYSKKQHSEVIAPLLRLSNYIEHYVFQKQN